MIIIATFALNVAHPGPVFGPTKTSTNLAYPEETAENGYSGSEAK